MELTRREVLGASAGALTGSGLAGCLEETALGSTNGVESGYAAFFTLWDWAERVGGDDVSFENPVEVGQTGHGWTPDADVSRDVAASDAFVYLDTPEFAWAQDVAETLERDYDDIVVIDGLEGLDLLEWDDDHDHGHDDSGHDEAHGDGHGEDHENGHDDHGDEHENGDGDYDDHGDGDHADEDHADEENGHDQEDHANGEETGSSGENYDPHVWTDPVRAQEIVATIATALADADPDNADRYESNAETYTEELGSLDDEFRALVDGADRTEAVLAGHDSYRYLEDRYGFDLRTPVGVSPGDRPSQSDVADTIEFVNDRGIETILYDRFESPALAETIVENSDAAEIAPVTSGEGTTAEWRDAGWGYVEQQREVTIPALERALGA